MATTLSFSFTFFSFSFSFFNMVKATEVTKQILNCIQKKAVIINMSPGFTLPLLLVEIIRHALSPGINYTYFLHYVAIVQRLLQVSQHSMWTVAPSWHQQKPRAIQKKTKNTKLHIVGTSDFFIAVPKFTVVIVVWTFAGWIDEEGKECVSGGFVLIWSHCVGSLWSSRGSLWVACPGGW